MKTLLPIFYDDYQCIPLKSFKTAYVYSTFWFTIINDELVFTGKFFKKVKVRLQLCKQRYRRFEEYNYSFYWTNWEYTWKYTEIIFF